MAIDPAKTEGQRPVAVDDPIFVEIRCRLVEARRQHLLDLKNDVERLLDAATCWHSGGDDGALP